MTVAELLEILKDVPVDFQVRVADSDGHSDYSPVDHVIGDDFIVIGTF